MTEERNNQNFLRRKNRTRSKISGTAERPRLSVHKSNRYLSAQVIDDASGTTLVSATSKSKNGTRLPMKEQAEQLGKEIAKKAKEKKISKVVFDRGGYLYIGLVKTLADSARGEGLEF